MQLRPRPSPPSRKDVFVADRSVFDLRQTLKKRGVEIKSLRSKQDLVTQLKEVLAKDQARLREQRMAATSTLPSPSLPPTLPSSSTKSSQRGPLFRLPTDCTVAISQFLE